MTREEAIQYLEGMRIDRFKGYDSFGEFIKERNEAIDMAISALSAEHKDCTDFLCWILEEIMDEENWEMNAEADGEIIARKLKKLGLLDSKDGYYIRTPMYEALTEPSDLISRADLKDKWCDYLERAVGNFPITPADITAIIDEAPSVSADSYKDGYDDGIREERPKAYKIGYNDGYERGKAECVSAERVGEWTARKTSLEFVCSNCGEACWRDFHYCPNCGAKMKGGEE